MESDTTYNYHFRVIRSSELAGRDFAAVHDLFEMNYRQANHAYLDQSFEKLRFTALAYDRQTPVGFALGDAVRTPLPGMTGPRSVILAGICCVSPDHRRHGLFSLLEAKAIEASGVREPDKRSLVCGRMAHPASFRILGKNPSVVPKYGFSPTRWQREVGLSVAKLYGSELDPETFVVRGKGSPIGFPRMEIKVTEDEWLLFRPVNRERGDSLLAIAWAPDAPEGW